MTDASQPRLNRGHYLLVCALIAVLLLTPEGKVEHHASADGLTDTPLKAEELPDSLSRTTLLSVAGHPCAGPSGCQDHPHPRDDGQRLCGGTPESSCGGHDRTSDQAAGPGQRLPDAGEVLPESGMNLPPDFTTLPKHDKVKILCPSSKKDTSGGGESRREPTQHDTASQPRTERMLLQWNRAKRPLI